MDNSEKDEISVVFDSLSFLLQDHATFATDPNKVTKAKQLLGGVTDFQKKLQSIYKTPVTQAQEHVPVPSPATLSQAAQHAPKVDPAVVTQADEKPPKPTAAAITQVEAGAPTK